MRLARQSSYTAQALMQIIYAPLEQAATSKGR